MARIVRLLVELKGGARVAGRNIAQQTHGAAGGAVGRGLTKGATANTGMIKDLANGGRSFWSHMPKSPQLPGALSDAAHLSDEFHGGDHDDSEGDGSLFGGHLSEELAAMESHLLDWASLRTDTPADVLLSILSDMLDGREPDLREVALARSVLLRHLDLYEPLNSGTGHIRAATHLDAEVMDALMHQIGGGSSADTAGSRSASSAMEADRPPKGCASSTSLQDGQEQAEPASAESLRAALALLLVQPRPGRQSESEAEVEGEAGPSGRSCSGSESGVPARACVYVPAPVLDEVERALALADEWKYDTWHLAEVTKGHALSCLAFYLLHREGLISQFRIKPTKLARLLRTIEQGYADNPYHNSTHAADVLQTFHVLLRGAGLTTHYLDQVGLLAAYFAAVVHDHGHPGLTADFLIATSDPLAVRYNDRSPLENHHGASFFSMLLQPDMNVLAHLAQHEKNAFRKQVIDLVMATDMKQHFTLLSHFNTAHHLPSYNKDVGPWALAAEPVRPVKQSSTEQAAAGVIDGADQDVAGAEAAASFDLLGTFDPKPLDDTERTLTLQIMLKAADLGHLGEDVEVHQRWVRALEEEFFRQGDKEQALGLPISPLFDRTKQGVSKSQVGFYDFIALPLVHALASAFPGARPLLACYVTNYDHWRAVEKAAATA
ncbi:hypothetical protein HYH02_003987 [Chlamydomonas schloesseri]|uniref:PDEase domain-containing protein n=1 Tax=Chlamydomonas schloesseri TaxID=2026947 RepID=A0A836B920_9CHLO|nr:hypothetical protein HYH02_003987 [Chlamydomonas schloesseri]|eukprot:KAG2451386.1 hypothetical protein HYH02_003987 [Chlamydomonas schloesseri]